MIRLSEALPPVAALLEDLADARSRGAITSYEGFVAECRRRWDPPTMAAVDEVIPLWSTMASYADGRTLWHVTEAMLALFALDEYRAAGRHRRTLLEWTVMLHDIAKQPGQDWRDHPHAFRSAAAALPILPRLGVATTSAFGHELDAWQEVALGATRLSDPAGEPIQDNRHLGTILAGATRMLEPAGARIIAAIALHLSITVVQDWPSHAPLTAQEQQQFVTPDVADLLLPLMLADSGGWNLFTPTTLRAMYAETRRVFADMAAPPA